MADNKIAEGGYLLASNLAIKVSQLTNSISSRLLEKAASMSGEEAERYLMYPEDVPISLELQAKQIKDKWKKVSSLMPAYLAERGVIIKKYPSLADKIEAEHKEYINDIKKLSKDGIIAMASDISKKNDMYKNFTADNICKDNLGLLLAVDNLLEAIEEAAVATNGDFEAAVEEVAKTVPEDLRQACLEPFRKEIQVAKKQKYKAITTTLNMPDDRHVQMSMPLMDFYDYLDPAVLMRFSEKSMPDFPCKNYYGVDGGGTYETLRAKRFISDFKKNYDGSAREMVPHYSITIDGFSKKPYSETNNYKEVENRYKLKTYIESCYEDKEPPLSKIAEYFRANREMLSAISEMVSE